jgi:hypothetical protein
MFQLLHTLFQELGCLSTKSHPSQKLLLNGGAVGVGEALLLALLVLCGELRRGEGNAGLLVIRHDSSGRMESRRGAAGVARTCRFLGASVRSGGVDDTDDTDVAVCKNTDKLSSLRGERMNG